MAILSVMIALAPSVSSPQTPARVPVSGTEWAKVELRLLESLPDEPRVRLSPNGKYIAANLSAGVGISSDFGKNWKPLKGLVAFHPLYVDYVANDGSVYLESVSNEPYASAATPHKRHAVFPDGKVDNTFNIKGYKATVYDSTLDGKKLLVMTGGNPARSDGPDATYILDIKTKKAKRITANNTFFAVEMSSDGHTVLGIDYDERKGILWRSGLKSSFKADAAHCLSSNGKFLVSVMDGNLQLRKGATLVRSLTQDHGAERNYASFVSNAGDLVIATRSKDGVSVWRQKEGWTPLIDIVRACGAAADGWSLTGVYNVSEDGRTILAQGLVDGHTMAVVIRFSRS